MKFFWSMVGFLILIVGAFYIGYQTDLGPVDEASDASQYGYGSLQEQPIGGVHGGSTSTSSGLGSKSGSIGGNAKRCVEGARC